MKKEDETSETFSGTNSESSNELITGDLMQATISFGPCRTKVVHAQPSFGIEANKTKCDKV